MDTPALNWADHWNLQESFWEGETIGWMLGGGNAPSPALLPGYANAPSTFSLCRSSSSQLVPLMTGCLATLQNYDKTLHRYIHPDFEVPVVVSSSHPIWSHDHILGDWQVAHIYDHLQHSAATLLQFTLSFCPKLMFISFLAKKKKITHWMQHSFKYHICLMVIITKKVAKSVMITWWPT